METNTSKKKKNKNKKDEHKMCTGFIVRNEKNIFKIAIFALSAYKSIDL